ncbi:MarR family transcriptional regulator [Pseudofrankia sp. DC12]|uniref:MarR family winged helix-turn-helix transcriptional regulator n=1 Tax=Pseudofrankia sp. DC12 TaxID=683315 RepID=UPI001E46247F|nr:MarR family transcriptional regulator [Pseudofrankia sp. DC12]
MSPHTNEVPDGLHEAGEALHHLLTAAVRQQPREISLTAASTLATIERTGPRRITDLAVTERITQPSMTALVTTLVRAGLAERRQDPQDQRVVLVALTPPGAQYLVARRLGGAEAFVRLIEKLKPDEVAALRAAAPALRRLHELGEELRTGTTGPDW